MADTLKEWLSERPPSDSVFTQTLAGIARRAESGESFFVAVREFLDEFALMQADHQRASAISEAPKPTGTPRHDAYLGALGEHLALQSGLPQPVWTCSPSRFLDRFWFVSETRGFRAIAISQSPAAFRRRGIFIAASSLTRV
jgi:hypothetical protein